MGTYGYSQSLIFATVFSSPVVYSHWLTVVVSTCSGECVFRQLSITGARVGIIFGIVRAAEEGLRSDSACVRFILYLVIIAFAYLLFKSWRHYFFECARYMPKNYFQSLMNVTYKCR